MTAELAAMSLPRITLAVVNYNSAEHVDALLSALTDEGLDRAVVFDNRSAQSDVLRLRQVCSQHDWVSLVEGDENLGFGAGVNRAVAALDLGSEDLVWVVNPDVTPESGTCRRLASAIAAGSADIVGPMLLSQRGSQTYIVFAGGRIDWRLGTTVHALWGKPINRARRGLTRTGFMTGAAFMTSAKTWRRLGGMREDYFLYWEDADFSVRATQAGLTMAVDCESLAWHHVGGSSDDTGRGLLYYKYMVRNRQRFLAEWAPRNTPGVRVLREIETLRLAGRAMKETDSRVSKIMAVFAARVGADR
jgi:N-acetylglucosaminyl-diphospho-decaprenol L-rhamnosyltransferase